jgi:hypothetical protein
MKSRGSWILKEAQSEFKAQIIPERVPSEINQETSRLQSFKVLFVLLNQCIIQRPKLELKGLFL